MLTHHVKRINPTVVPSPKSDVLSQISMKPRGVYLRSAVRLPSLAA